MQLASISNGSSQIRMSFRFKDLVSLIQKTFTAWSQVGASRLAAALAYYTIFSLAPLLVIVIALVGFFWQSGDVQAQIVGQLQRVIGPQAAQFVRSLIESSRNLAQNSLAQIIGIGVLIWGAIGAFNELQNALNLIWEVEPPASQPLLESIKETVIDRFLSFAMVLGIGFLLLVYMLANAALSAIEGYIQVPLLPDHLLVRVASNIVPVIAITVFFALIFKLLPDTDVAWRDVWLGAAVTALLFLVGNWFIGLYLRNSSITSAYGAAGSLVLLLIWIYYSAQILFWGAAFTHVYASTYGSLMRPAVEALPVPPQKKLTAPQVSGYFPLPESERQGRLRRTAAVLVGLAALGLAVGLAALQRLFRQSS
jgi:membrane protein